MIKLAVIEKTVEGRNQIPEHDIESTIHVVGGNDFADEVFNSDITSTPVVVLNIKLKGRDGLDIVNQIEEKKARVCVFLTSEDYVSMNKENLITTVNKVLLDYNLISEKVKRVSLFLNSEMSPEVNVGDDVFDGFSKKLPKNPECVGLLTSREIELMSFLSKGLLYKEISVSMGISLQTVKCHLKHIYSKLQVKNRTEAILRFIQVD